MIIAPWKWMLIVLAASIVAACAADAVVVEKGAAGGSTGYDPVTMDASIIDPDNPPTTVELSFDSGGAALNGHLYLANGAGPHPTVVLLHGLPGNEKNLDVAQAARRAGYNVLFFHYRGAWGSEGDYSFANVVEDALAAAAFLRSDRSVADYRVDPSRIIYLGHSMGGYAALSAGARDKEAVCIGAMSPADLGAIAASFEDENQRAGFAAYMDMIGEPDSKPGKSDGDKADKFGPLRGVNGARAVAEIAALGKTHYNPSLAAEFAGRSILLTAAKGDNVLPPEAFHKPLAAAYAATPEISFTEKMFESDHTYSWERVALARTIIAWLDAECR